MHPFDPETDFVRRLSPPGDEAPRAEHARELRARVLAEFDQARAVPPAPAPVAVRILQIGRDLMRRPTFRLSIVAALLAVAFTLLGPGQERIAFADLLETFMEARTARFQMEVKAENQPAQKFKAWYQAPASIRQEIGSVVNISDFKAGKILSLDPTNKVATLLVMKNRPKDKSSGNFFHDVRETLKGIQAKPDGSTEALPEKVEDGRRLIGYRATSPMTTISMWGDAATGRLVRIESEMRMPVLTQVTMSDFEFDVPLDEKLFSTEPPEGYKVNTIDVDVSPATDKEFADVLDTLADTNDGVFPSKLDATLVFSAMLKQMSFTEDNPPTDAEIQELMKASIKLGRGLQFALQLPKSAEARYAGKGVKKGTADTPIFWYKPEGKTTWRVISADLSIKDMDTAPAVPAEPVLTPESDRSPASAAAALLKKAPAPAIVTDPKRVTPEKAPILKPANP